MNRDRRSALILVCGLLLMAAAIELAVHAGIGSIELRLDGSRTTSY